MPGVFFAVTHSINTGFSNQEHSCLSLMNNVVAVCGQRDYQFWVKLLELPGGEERFCAKLNGGPYGIAQVTFEGKLALALSYM